MAWTQLELKEVIFRIDFEDLCARTIDPSLDKNDPIHCDWLSHINLPDLVNTEKDFDVCKAQQRVYQFDVELFYDVEFNVMKVFFRFVYGFDLTTIRIPDVRHLMVVRSTYRVWYAFEVVRKSN